MRWLFGVIMAVLWYNTGNAQPLVEAVRALDEAISILQNGPKSPEKRRVIEKLVFVRAKLTETISAQSVTIQQGQVGIVGGSSKVEVTAGQQGGTTVTVTVSGGGQPEAKEAKTKMLPRGPQPISPHDFSELLAGLKKISFGSEKIAFIKDAIKHHYFTTDQVKEVVGLFQFGADKVEAASMMYPRVIDKKNFFKVYSALEFEGDREELRKKIEKWDKVGLPSDDDEHDD